MDTCGDCLTGRELETGVVFFSTDKARDAASAAHVFGFSGTAIRQYKDLRTMAFIKKRRKVVFKFM